MQRGVVVAHDYADRHVSVQLPAGPVVVAQMLGRWPAMGATAILDELGSGSWLCYGNVDPGGSVCTYTPTVTGAGWTVGNAVLGGSYLIDGDLVHLEISMVLGSTSVGGAGAITFSTPVTASRATRAPGWADGIKGGSRFGGVCEITASLLTPYTMTAASAGAYSAGWGTGFPSAGAWANGDEMYLAVDYLMI